MNLTRYSTLSVLILVTAALRLLPHPPNFTPIAALALFSGAHLRNSYARFLVPLLALFLSDLVIGFHVLMPWVYGSFAATVALGNVLRPGRSPRKLAIAGMSAAILFFVVTNFAMWAYSDTFPKTAIGLGACYLAGLPFLANEVLGDAFYLSILFGGWAFAEIRFITLREPVQMGSHS